MKLTYGMIGGGPGAFIGVVHRNAIRLDDTATLVCGSFSRFKDKSDVTAAELGIDPARTYATFEDMAASEGAREDKIDWVSIVTPNHNHYPSAKAFLNQGINVVCDKPLTLTIDEALELKQLAREKGCLFAVTHTYTGYVMVREARQLFRDGLIGDVRMVMAEYPQDWILDALESATDMDRQWVTDPSLAGRGGVCADIGTHVQNMIEYITGLKIDSLLCNLDFFEKNTPMDTNMETLVRFKGGATGILWASQVAIGCDNGLKIRVFGTKGTLEFYQENCNDLKVTLRGQPPMTYSRGAEYLTEEASKHIRVPGGHPEGYTEAFGNLYKDFAAAVRDKKEGKTVNEEDYGYPTIDMGIAGVEFFNKCVDSSRAGGAWVKLDH